MPKRVTIAQHSNISELEQLYKHAKDGIESRKARLLKLPPADFTSVSNHLVTSARKENRGSRANNGLQQNLDLRIGEKV
jgi:hypothetical protein